MAAERLLSEMAKLINWKNKWGKPLGLKNHIYFHIVEDDSCPC